MFQLERLHFLTPNANLTSLCITINGLALHLERAGKEAPLRYLLAVLGDTASPLLLDRARCCMHPQLGSMHQGTLPPPPGGSITPRRYFAEIVQRRSHVAVQHFLSGTKWRASEVSPSYAAVDLPLDLTHLFLEPFT